MTTEPGSYTISGTEAERMAGADLPSAEQIAAMRGMIEAMQPKRDRLVIALLAAAAAAFVAFLGWIAVETYNHNGRLSGLETSLRELKTAVGKLDETIGKLPGTLQASLEPRLAARLHDSLEPRLATNLQASVATVLRNEIGALKTDVAALRDRSLGPIPMHVITMPPEWQAVVDGLKGRLEAVEKMIQVRGETPPG